MEGLSNFMPFILMFVIVYFFMIAPQMKRAKKEKRFAAALKKGDRVITKSGMHGKVAELNDKDASCVGHNFHGRYEYVPLESILSATEVICKIAELTQKKYI